MMCASYLKPLASPPFLDSRAQLLTFDYHTLDNLVMTYCWGSPLLLPIHAGSNILRSHHVQMAAFPKARVGLRLL